MGLEWLINFLFLIGFIWIGTDWVFLRGDYRHLESAYQKLNRERNRVVEELEDVQRDLYEAEEKIDRMNAYDQRLVAKLAEIKKVANGP